MRSTTLSMVQDEERRHRLHAVADGELLAAIDVELEEVDRRHLGGELAEDRLEHAAGAAPGGGEVDEGEACGVENGVEFVLFELDGWCGRRSWSGGRWSGSLFSFVLRPASSPAARPIGGRARDSVGPAAERVKDAPRCGILTKSLLCFPLEPDRPHDALPAPSAAPRSSTRSTPSPASGSRASCGSCSRARAASPSSSAPFPRSPPRSSPSSSASSKRTALLRASGVRRGAAARRVHADARSAARSIRCWPRCATGVATTSTVPRDPSPDGRPRRQCRARAHRSAALAPAFATRLPADRAARRDRRWRAAPISYG